LSVFICECDDVFYHKHKIDAIAYLVIGSVLMESKWMFFNLFLLLIKFIVYIK